MKNAARIVLAAAALVQCLVMASAATHTVGDSFGWSIPPNNNASFYPAWAASQKFNPGDNIVFNFAAGAHDVVEVPKSSYDSCSTTNQIGSTLTASPATITLTSTGDRYFFCGIPGHCGLGQKVTISVASTAATPPTPATTTAPPPPPTPTATAPPPPPTPTATAPPPSSPSVPVNGPAAGPTGTVPGAAASLTSGGRIAAVSAVVLSLASYFLL